MGESEKNVSVLVLSFVLLVMLFGGIRLNNHQDTTRLTIGFYSDAQLTGSTKEMYDHYDRIIEKFEAKFPGTKVNYTSGIPGEEYSEWLGEKLLKGEEPDAFLVMPGDFEMLAESGALCNLDDPVSSDYTFDPEVYYKPAMDFGRFRDNVYALPISCVPTIMFVNKTLLEDNGMTMPDDDWTWDEFYDICQKISESGKGEFGVYGYGWKDAVRSNGASLFSGDGKTCNLTDDKIQEAIRFQIRLDALNGGYTVRSKDFDLGRVAFRPFSYSEYRAYQPYPWRVKKYTGFEWDGIQMPKGPHGDNVSEIDTLLMGISAHSDNKEMAWEFVKMCSSDEELQKGFYSCLRGISPLKAVAENDRMVDVIMEDMPGERVFNKDTIGSIMSKAVTKPRFAGYEQAENMADKIIQQEMYGDSFEESMLLTEQRKINNYLMKQ